MLLEDEAWRRPLLVDSSIKNFKTNIVDWQTVVTNRNETLRKAVDIASKTHANSTSQATMLGKYSSLIEQSSEKVSQASSLLDEQVRSCRLTPALSPAPVVYIEIERRNDVMGRMKVTVVAGALQSAQIGELNKTVNEVIDSMNTPADLDLSSFAGMVSYCPVCM